MKKTLVFLLCFTCVGLLTKAAAAPETYVRPPSSFDINVRAVNGNSVELTCNKGCQWETLKFSCEGSDSNVCESRIDDWGMLSESE